MTLRLVFNVVSLLQIFVGLSMLAATGVAAWYGDGDATGIGVAGGVTIFLGLVGTVSTRTKKKDVSAREGFAIVTFAWLATGMFGSLPYLFTGSIPHVIPAFFESLSGFTTTGATVLSDIEALPHGILFWRSLTHWLGGMGIIVLAIAVLPYLGIGGMQLFKAEVPGPTPERLRPRITQTAKLLWYVYVFLTATQVLLYVVGGMGTFDAVNHAFATLATGGFSTKNASLGAFSSPFIHWVTVVFMYLAGVNFALHFRAATTLTNPKAFPYAQDSEWRFFTRVIFTAALSVFAVNMVANLYPLTLSGIEHGLRDAFFQVVSITTTTGFATADYELWVAPAQVMLFVLMFVGGMAGSTSGGIKAVRILLLLKHTAIQIRKHLHPRAVLLARIGGRPVKEDVLATVVGFVILYVLLVLSGMVLMSLMGMDFMTSLSVSAATVGNIGPGLGDVGPTDNYGWISNPALLVLSFFMIVGRLEIYTVLVLFSREVWRRD